MAYDEGLAERVREYFTDQLFLEEKRMFGGLCFMLSGHMCCGIDDELLMCRVGPKAYHACLAMPFAKPMDFTGKALKGFVYVTEEGIAEDQDLHWWLGLCQQFVSSLPPKKKH